jgi:hypothetical protein
MRAKARRGRGISLGALSALALVVAVVLGAWTLPHAKAGDVDPLSAVVALVALVVSGWSGYLSLRALRWQETNLADAANRLVLAVRDDERDARRQLLGGHDRTIDVDFAFRPAPSHNAQFAAVAGHLEQVVSYYRALRPGRLVITGAPGAGKTVLAVELILGLAETRAPEDPVPVRLSAASWDTSHPVEAWLTEHLVQTYQLPPATAAALVDARLVLPVIDGLDEMDPDPQPGYNSRAAQALRALNAYQNDRAKADLVLTCRSGQYQALEAMRVWAEDAAQVQINPVTVGKANAFIHRRVNDPGRWQKVLDTIDQQPAGTLASGLSTPWRLSLAATVYEHRDPQTGVYLRDPNDLVNPALNSPEAVRDHLLELFIPAATASQQTKEPAYSSHQVRTWLTNLASYLNANATTHRTLGGRPLSGTDMALHELWPLAGSRKPRAVTVAMLAAFWLIATPALLLIFGVGFSGRQVLGASVVAAGAIIAAQSIWANVWPEPNRADLNLLLTQTGRRKVARQFAVGVAIGVAVGVAVGGAAGFAGGFGSGVAGGAALGAALGAAFLGVVGLVLGVEAPGQIGVTDPRGIVRNNLTVAVALGVASGVAGGVALGVASGVAGGVVGGVALGVAGWVVGGVAAGLAAGLTGGLVGGLAGFRYIALLLCTRKRTTQWLPWRLGTFLDWCYTVGLTRKAGIAYQFRHRELQDYLAQHQTT